MILFDIAAPDTMTCVAISLRNSSSFILAPLRRRILLFVRRFLPRPRLLLVFTTSLFCARAPYIRALTPDRRHFRQKIRAPRAHEPRAKMQNTTQFQCKCDDEIMPRRSAIGRVRSKAASLREGELQPTPLTATPPFAVRLSYVCYSTFSSAHKVAWIAARRARRRSFCTEFFHRRRATYKSSPEGRISHAMRESRRWISRVGQIAK